MNPNTPTPIYGHSIPPVVLATDCDVSLELAEAKERERVAIVSWDEERERALREGHRVIELRAEVERLKTENRAYYDEKCSVIHELNEAEVTDNSPVEGVQQLRAHVTSLIADKDRLASALNDATTSLCTLSQQSGRTEELRELCQIRGYAFSRYSAAIDSARAKT